MSRRKRLLNDLDQEIRDHVAIETQDNIDRGMSPEEARYAALRKFGNATRVAEDAWAVWSCRFLGEFPRDIRFAIRKLWKSPGFTAIAVLTLALGIGANTAVFSMVNAVLLHPYPFRNLDQIVLVWEDTGSDGSLDDRFIAPGDAADIGSYSGAFQALATYRCRTVTLASGADLHAVFGCGVSANLFDVLGVAPAYGRSFTDSDELPGFDNVAIVSYGFWKRELGGDPHMIGKAIRINDRTTTVTGIMPANFGFPVTTQLWTPLALSPAQRADRSRLSVQAIARLKNGVSAGQARAAVAAIAARAASAYPKTNGGRRATAMQLRRELYQFTLPLFSLLQVAAAFVLLLACANVTNLLLARMATRQKEIALRLALGAGRRILAQLFVSEAVVFSIVAAIATLIVSLWSVKLLRTSISPEWTKWVPGWDSIQVDAEVLWFTFAIAVVAGGIFALLTLFHARRIDVNDALKEGSRGSLTRSRGRLRASLVVVQVIFALVLLVCAGLTIRGFTRVADVYGRFKPENVVEIEPVLPAKSYTDNAKIADFYQRLLQRTAALPGITGAALARNPPASNVDNETTKFVVEGREAPRPADIPSADLQIASPDYFRVLQVALTSGRAFSDADRAGSAPVAIINRSMSAKFWPQGEAIGQHITLIDGGAPSPSLVIVGVVDDIRQNWWDALNQPTIYEPMLQAPQRGLALLCRTESNPAGYISSLRTIIRQIDASVAVKGGRTFDQEVNDSIAIIRVMGILMGVFGGVALALSAIGVYGIMTQSVAQRTFEIGIPSPLALVAAIYGR